VVPLPIQGFQINRGFPDRTGVRKPSGAVKTSGGQSR
jgi:hypothetical protein